MRVLTFILVSVATGALLAGCPTGSNSNTLSISPRSVELTVGQSTTLSVTSTDTTDFFTWATNNADVATVDSRGRVMAIAEGTARITATSGRSGSSVSATVTVVASDDKIETVTVAPSAATIAVGGTVNLAAATTGADLSFLWYSNDEAIATVDSNGSVTGVAAGTTTITARGASPEEQAQATITVVDPVSHTVSIRPLGASILMGDTVALSAVSSDPLDTFIWTSDLDSTATVDENGVVTGIGSGGVVINAQGTNSGAIGSAVIDVARRAEHRVTVSPSTVTLAVGDAVALDGSTTRGGDTLSWSSEDPTIATVNAVGAVTGIAPGTVSVIAQGAEADERGVSNVRVVEGRVRVATVRPISVSIPVGESIALTATSRDDAESFSWESNDSAVAVVDESGVVTGVAPGEVEVSAVGMNTGATGRSIIQVVAPVVHQIVLAPTSAGIEVGETFSFVATSTRSGDRIAWSIDEESVATVDQSGVVTGVGPGNAMVTATGLDSAVSGSAAVEVSVAVAQVVEVHPRAASIATGETIALTAESTDALDTFEWFSSDDAVAEVSQLGIVTGISAGMAEISANGDNSLESGTATITVTEPVSHRLQVFPGAASVEVGETVSLVATSTRNGDLAQWSSEDEAVARVDATGLVTGVASGIVTISAVGSLSGATSIATITVSESVIEEAVVRPLEAGILVGESVALTAESSDALESFTWESSDSAVASVNTATGLVTGTGMGTATITGTGTNTGAVGTSTFTVTEPVVHELTVSPSEVLLVTGDTVQMTANTTREGDSISWTSSDTAVATVSASGLVSSLAAGTATITAQGSVANERDTATVTVVDAVVHTVTIEPRGANIVAGTTVALSASSTDAEDSFTWTSANTSVATVNSAGVVTGVVAGSAQIRARGTHSGVAAAVTVTVSEPVVNFVVVQPPSSTIEVGGTVTLTATSTDPADQFSWTSEDTGIATVNASGLVTGVAIGTLEIIATGSSSNLEDGATVTVVDTMAPTLTIDAPSVTATQGGPVTFRVTYAGATGITLSKEDVSIEATGSVSALLGNVTTTGERERMIKVDTVAGDGTFTISIAAGTAIDAAGNLAPAAGPSPVVMVDNTSPTLAIGEPSVTLTNTGPIDYRVSYNGTDLISLTKAHVLVNGTGNVAVTLADVTEVGDAERLVTFSALSGDGTIGFTIAEGTASDAAGNQTGEAGPSSTVVVDNTPPTITVSAPSTTITNDGPITYRVTYDGASEITLSDVDVLINGTGLVAVTVDDVTETSANVRTVTISNVAGDGTVGISIAEGTATDEAGNLAPATGPSVTVEVDNTAPTLVIGEPSVSVTSAGPVVYPVTYSGTDTVTLSEDDVTVTGSGTALAQVTEVVATGAATWNVTLGNVIGNGDVGISIAAGTAADAAGNQAPEAGPSGAVEVNNTAPTLLISEPSAENTFDEAVTYTVTYADAATITLAAGDVTLNSDDGVTATVAVSGTGTAQRTVTLSNFTGNGEASISLAANTAQNNAAVPALPAGPSQPFHVNPLLEPGAGFTEPTPQPDPIGDASAFAADAKAIARWDVVPYQTFEGYFEIGVVAFHINDIDRVEFSVDNGPWLAVREMTLNPRTGVVEYWVGLDARDFEDGPLEVRAVAFPVIGIPRVLGGEYDLMRSYRGTQWTGEHSLELNTNANQSLTNQVVELAAGRYTWGEPPVYFGSQPDQERWLIYRPAPGVDASEVIIDHGVERFPRERDYKRIKLENLQIDGSSGQMTWFSDIDDMLWFDGVRIIGPGRWVQPDDTGAAFAGHQWWTDCHVSDARFGQATQFVRNCKFERIGEDVIAYGYLVVNVDVSAVGAGPTLWHSGVIANPIVHDNRIYYNMVSRDIDESIVFAFRNGTYDYWENFDIAVIDCDSEMNNQPQTWSCGADTRNLYVRNSRFVGGEFIWRLEDSVPEYWKFKAHNVVLEDVNIKDNPNDRPIPHPLDGVTFRYSDGSKNN